ncbi:MAG: ATP-binding protein [Nitrospirota bacterium]|nr:ATP-binding protein [Nitrospirota bacterium]
MMDIMGQVGVTFDHRLFEQLPIGVCILQQNGTILVWNGKIAKWTGCDKHSMVGKNFLTVFPDDATSGYWKRIEQVFEGGSPVSLSFPVDAPLFFTPSHGPTDLVRHATVSGVPTSRPEQYLALIAIEGVSEITRYDQADCQFHERILQSAGSGIIGLDCDGNMAFVNPAAIRMLGWEGLDVVGRSLHDNLQCQCQETEGKVASAGPLCAMTALPQLGTSRQVAEDWFTRKDGTRFPVEFVSTPILEDDDIVGVVVTFNDISDRRCIEQEVLRYAVKLEEEVDLRTGRIRQLKKRRMEVEKLAALAQVAAGVAHEINNPLAGIKNAFHLVKGAVPKNHRHAGYVKRIDEEIERIVGIIRRMYQLYRPEAVEMRSVQIADLIQDVCLIVDSQREARKVSIKIDLLHGLPCVRVSARDLTQVLCNVVQNAIQASSVGQQVTISATQSETAICISIRDDGAGMTPDVLPHIFEPFFTTKQGSPQGGMGLGLSVSQSLLEAMGGEVSVKSLVGSGSTFSLRVPMSPTATQSFPSTLNFVERTSQHG